MQFGHNGWTLDLGRVEHAITPRTRALFLVSPSNPTGWTASLDELRQLLALSRRHNIWILADETYARFWYGEGERAPSFHDVMAPEDRILFVNTFSKNWAMTGWRVGWITAHPSLGQTVENMIQYSTSGVAGFMQRACVVALERGESFVAHQIARARESRDVVCLALAQSGRCQFAAPAGAFYVLFAVEGVTDTRRLAFRLIDDAKVGMAPGSAFGAGGGPFLRVCFARTSRDLVPAMERVNAVISNL